jgi:hypothetical protein
MATDKRGLHTFRTIWSVLDDLEYSRSASAHLVPGIRVKEVREMATKVTVSLIDDFDGKSADETVQFGLDGVSYEIDLSENNAKKMREGLRPWVDAGRRIGGSRRRAVGTGGVSVDRKQSAEIREWAHKSGYEVARRGRIPAEVRAAYRAAQ